MTPPSKAAMAALDRLRGQRGTSTARRQSFALTRAEVDALLELERELRREYRPARRAFAPGPCPRCEGDGYLPESTLTAPVFCSCSSGVARSRVPQ